MTLEDLLVRARRDGASDLHLAAGAPAALRVDGRLTRLDDAPLTPADTRRLACSALTDAQRAQFDEALEIDFSFESSSAGRVRCHLFYQRGAVNVVCRLVPDRIRSLDELGLPPVVASLACRPRGLVLVTGATGSGKSTTLAAMVDKINRERPGHILTIEDPVEVVHAHQMCLVTQREVLHDAHDFARALRAALRADPDVVLVGEMRDHETIEAALRLAETGHLTLATLHANSAAQAVHRIVDAFPAHQHVQVRTRLSFVLEGVVCQTLVPCTAGGRVAAVEVMVATAAIRNLVREDKLHQVYSAMQTGQETVGMQTMNQALAALCRKGVITYDTAVAASSNHEELDALVTRAGGALRGLTRGRLSGSSVGAAAPERG